MIEKDSGIPYYCQLMELIQQKIAAGSLQEGEKIASEAEMSGFYRVNRHTVRQAVGELCRQGVLYKVKGRGTFVAKPPLDLLEYRLSPKNRFTENIRQIGKVPDSRLLHFAETAPPEVISEALGLKQGDTVYLLEILRHADGRPFLLSKVYLPAHRLPGLAEHTQSFYSLFAIFERYGILPRRVKSVIRASFPSSEEAMVLGVPGNMPVLKVESVLKTQDNILIEYNVSCYRGDLAKLSVDW